MSILDRVLPARKRAKELETKLETTLKRDRKRLKKLSRDLERQSVEIQGMTTPVKQWPPELVEKMEKLKIRQSVISKSFLNMRAQQNYYPETPEVIPYPQNENALISMARRVAVLRATIENLKTEGFRVPPVLKHRFEVKCPRCGAEYQQYKEFCDDPMCTIQGIRTVRPDVSQKRRWDEVSKVLNRNGQDYIDLGKVFTEYMLMTDNPWILVSYDYVTDPVTGMVIAQKPVEFTHTPANTMRIVQDEYGVPGGLYWTCIEHRDVLFTEENKYEPCPHCHRPLYDVTAVSVKLNQPATQSIRETIDKPYITGEWFHDPYFTETITYGVSPVYTLWILSSSLYYMDELENSTFKHGRPPKSLLIFNTFNPESLHAQMIDEFDKAKLDREYTPKIAFPNEGKGNQASVLNLMPNDSEVQTLEHRRDIRERMAALYGMSPFMLADVSVGGGLNNEGMQMTIMLRRLESIHNWLEQGLYRFILNAYGITDWCIAFPPLKEEDRMATLERRKANLQMIGEILNRGADYRIIDDTDLQFEIVGKMGMLTQGAMGTGFKEMGGSGWDPRDWQRQDASFAFSKQKGEVMGKDTLSDLVRRFMDDMRVVMRLGDDLSVREAWSRFRDGFIEYMHGMVPVWLRDGLDMSGHTPATAELTEQGIDQVSSLHNPDGYVADLEQDFLDRLLNVFVSAPDPERELQEIMSELLPRLVNIERTQGTALVNLGTVLGYQLDDPDDVLFDYYWDGPDYVEGRSTLVCQAIKERFEQARSAYGRVSLADAERIIDQEGSLPHGDEKSFNLGMYLCPHYQCRHRLLAVPFSSSGETGFGKTLVYLADPGKAPPGVNVIQGPKGGYYYDTSETQHDKEKDGNELPDPDDVKTPSEDDDDGSDRMGEGEGGQGKYQAIGIRAEGDGNVMDIKYYDAGQEKEVEEAMSQAGYELSPDPVTVEVREAVPGGKGPSGGDVT